jgi:hypothetical protein
MVTDMVTDMVMGTGMVTDTTDMVMGTDMVTDMVMGTGMVTDTTDMDTGAVMAGIGTVMAGTGGTVAGGAMRRLMLAVDPRWLYLDLRLLSGGSKRGVGFGRASTNHRFGTKRGSPTFLV